MASKMESNQEIKKIKAEFQRYRQDTDKEIKILNKKITKLQKMVEKNIIQEDSPDEYEVKAIKDFEANKSKIQFVPLDSLN
ncbi:MAG: hypothetical protein WD154_00960 [Nitrosopumilaceae archaeon]